MPKRKLCFERKTLNAKRRNLNIRNETRDENEVRLKIMRNNANRRRANETVSFRAARLQAMRNNANRTRANETVSNREVRLREDRNRAVIVGQTHWADLKCAAFHYESGIDYQ